MRNLIRLIVVAGILSGIGCEEGQTGFEAEQRTIEFYEVYAQRQDFDRFLEFYAEDAVLEDVITSDRNHGREEIRRFFNWGSTDFQLLEPVALTVENIVSSGNYATVSGYFSGFKWYEEEFGPIYFITELTFDDNGQITRHIDWINYPARLIDCESLGASNSWIGNRR